MISDPLKYRRRFYRNSISSGNLVSYEVKVKESDLLICSERDLSETARNAVIRYRRNIEEYIRLNPKFLTSFSPIPADPLAPSIVKDMIRETSRAGVGPMAAVAGAIAQYVGDELLKESDNVIVENGGDIYLRSYSELRIGVFAGGSPLSGRVRLLIRGREKPYGICTSSATVGHSVSLGCADAVCVVSGSAILSDAVATAVGNLVKSESVIMRALDFGLGIEGVAGVLIIAGERLGVRGDIELG